MDIISQNKRICYLIAKQLWEGLDDVERRELEAWRQLEPENEVLYLKLTNREKVSRYVEKRASIDMKKYAMVYDREIGLGVRGKMNKLWGYAAAILVLCVIGVTIWMNELKQNEANQLAQVTIEPGVWFAARLKEPSTFALVSCAVAPGFEFEDFELANRDLLLSEYPDYKKEIMELTRK